VSTSPDQGDRVTNAIIGIRIGCAVVVLLALVIYYVVRNW
jgi:hypothetical protein